MVHDARRVDHVEGARLQTGAPQVGLHELHPIESEALRRRGAEPQRGSRQIGADDDAIGTAGQRQYLAGPAPDPTMPPAGMA